MYYTSHYNVKKLHRSGEPNRCRSLYHNSVACPGASNPYGIYSKGIHLRFTSLKTYDDLFWSAELFLCSHISRAHIISFPWLTELRCNNVKKTVWFKWASFRKITHLSDYLVGSVEQNFPLHPDPFYVY